MRNPEHEFRTRMALALPLEEVFAFFADAGNLERITPPQLRFRILTPTPLEIRAGSVIDYRLSLFRVSFRWRTEIAEWRPPFEFVDVQSKGPYAQWIHRHNFREEEGLTVIEDVVRYRLPIPLLGEMALPFVKGQVRAIFRHREEQIRRLLPIADGPGVTS